MYYVLILYLSNTCDQNLDRLVVRTTQRHVIAEICHFENGPIITISSKDWGLKKQLFRFVDTINT